MGEVYPVAAETAVSPDFSGKKQGIAMIKADFIHFRKIKSLKFRKLQKGR
jgi:hypothetical protein